MIQLGDFPILSAKLSCIHNPVHEVCDIRIYKPSLNKEQGTK
jgi:hypothetical protein